MIIAIAPTKKTDAEYVSMFEEHFFEKFSYL